jgi:hypothetical protein
MTATASAQRPRVIGIVLLALLGALVNIAGGVILLAAINQLRAESTEVQSWAAPTAYFLIVLGILDAVAAILIMRYKRMGLLLGALVFGVALLSNIYQVVTGAAISSVIVGVIIQLAVLYYIYLYLTREPDKTFFT